MRNSLSDAVLWAFSEEQVESLTGVTKSQLRYWDRTGFFKPSFADANRRVAFSRIYAFKDVAALRVINALRNQFNVPLQHLRKVAADLSSLSDAKWTATTLFVFNKRVIFVDPESRQYREIVSGQYVVGMSLSEVVAVTARDVEQLHKRDKSRIGKMSRSRNVSHNALVIAGTRIPVAAIRRFAEDGYSVDRIRQEYPTLTRADIKAALDDESSGLAA